MILYAEHCIFLSIVSTSPIWILLFYSALWVCTNISAFPCVVKLIVKAAMCLYHKLYIMLPLACDIWGRILLSTPSPQAPSHLHTENLDMLQQCCYGIHCGSSVWYGRGLLWLALKEIHHSFPGFGAHNQKWVGRLYIRASLSGHISVTAALSHTQWGGTKTKHDPQFCMPVGNAI